jgi:molybdopterin-guanine dinucleotide biosynthesis protein A
VARLRTPTAVTTSCVSLAGTLAVGGKLNIKAASALDLRYALGVSAHLADDQRPDTFARHGQAESARVRTGVCHTLLCTKVSAVIEADSCVGVVLAGGKSARMGVEKATLRIGGEALLARIVGRLRQALREVVVVGPPRLQTLVPDVTVFPDEIADVGPVGGLATALERVKSQHLFIVGCDMPFVEPALVYAMVRFAVSALDADVVALRTARGLEPLHAVYARSCATAVDELLTLETGRSLSALLGRLRVQEPPASDVARYDPAGRSTFNANSPKDWQEALTLSTQESDAVTSRREVAGDR